MLSLRRKDIVCQQAVELVTAYLEGALSRRERGDSRPTPGVPQLPAYFGQIKMTIELPGRSNQKS